MDSHLGLLFLALVMAGGFVICWRVIERYVLRVSPPKEFSAWKEELEQAAIEAIRADLFAAECRARLAELVGKVPEDFDPTAFLGIQIAAGVHRAVLQEAERRGLVRVGTYEEIYGPAYTPTAERPPAEREGPPPAAQEAQTPSLPPPSRAPDPPALPAAGGEVAPLLGLEFRDGKLQPRKPSE